MTDPPVRVGNLYRCAVGIGCSDGIDKLPKDTMFVIIDAVAWPMASEWHDGSGVTVITAPGGG